MVKVGHDMDLLGQDIVDFEERVNVGRLKRDRLARLQAQMAKYDLGGMLIFDPLNIRYATGIRNIALVVSMRWFIGYALVPQEGEPLITAGDDGDGRISVEKGAFWEHFPLGRNMEAASHLWGQRIADEMNQLGIQGQRLGVDRLDYYSVEALRSQEIRIADAREPFERARSIKTQDEISLMRQAAAIADVAITRVRDAIKPGVTENKLFSILAATNIEFGGEHMEARLLAAGGNTNPWLFRASSDRLVRPGDLVVYDTDMAGPMGYLADISRTYLCGDGKPNAEQIETYKIAHSFIYDSLHLFRPGTSFQGDRREVPRPARRILGPAIPSHRTRYRHVRRVASHPLEQVQPKLWRLWQRPRRSGGKHGHLLGGSGKQKRRAGERKTGGRVADYGQRS